MTLKQLVFIVGYICCHGRVVAALKNAASDDVCVYGIRKAIEAYGKWGTNEQRAALREQSYRSQSICF